MAKLWEKGYELEKGVEKFTVGDDYLLDYELVEADVLGSIAHAAMLAKIGILDTGELKKLRMALLDVLKENAAGSFKITPEDEDVHTAVENFLVAKLGDLGKKIHTGRSRNDQVLVDLRLYSKGKLLGVAEAVLGLAGALLKLADENKDVPIPGRTHTQLAMPSSVGLWAGAYAESLLDDLELVKSAYVLNDQCPLGSAASYGVNLPTDRQMVSNMLGFEKVQNNVLYANNSRGKVESIILAALSQVEIDLSKMAGDLIMFSIPEFGYFSLPEKYCTGSSMMPNKKNPDVLELVRAKANKVLAAYYQVVNTIKDLPSGYNRDFQETKAPLIDGLALTEVSLRVCSLVVSGLKVNKDACIKACMEAPEIFATDKAIELATGGIPWRDAYLKVADGIKDLKVLKAEEVVANIKSKKHIGATGNLELDKAAAKIKAEKALLDKESKAFEGALVKLKR